MSRVGPDMRTRRVAPVLLILLVTIALAIVHPPPAAADERDRFHVWLLAGPTFLLDGTPRFRIPVILSDPALHSPLRRCRRGRVSIEVASTRAGAGQPGFLLPAAAWKRIACPTSRRPGRVTVA